jgi:hypothetical protein
MNDGDLNQSTPDNPTPTGDAQTLDTASNQLFGIKPDADPSPAQTPTPQPTDGQAPAAPTDGQGDGTDATKDGKPVDPKGQPTEPTDEDLLAAMSPTETPEAQTARLKREAGASRKEALRLKKVSDGAIERLAEQGIDLETDDEGNVIGLSANEKYNKGEAANLSVKFSDMSEEQQEQFESNPQALIDHVLKQATSRLVRAVPTVEKRVSSISPEQEQSAIDHVAGLVLADGESKKHPNLEKNLPIIRQQIDAPSNSALRDFYNQQPDLALALLDAQVDKTRRILTDKASALAAAKDKKIQDANSSVSPAPSGGGEPVVVNANASVEEQGQAWSKAFGAAE